MPGLLLAGKMDLVRNTLLIIRAKIRSRISTGNRKKGKPSAGDFLSTDVLLIYDDRSGLRERAKPES